MSERPGRLVDRAVAAPGNHEVASRLGSLPCERRGIAGLRRGTHVRLDTVGREHLFGERGMGSHLIGDAAKGRQALGWKPTISIAEGIPATVDWYRRHGWL